MPNPQKYLHVETGPYGLLVSASDILEIADYAPGLCQLSGSAGQHHGKAVSWRNHTLPFLSLRHFLQLAPAEPANTVTLHDGTGQPAAMLAVDTICGILTVDEAQLFHFEGIHAELNALFDLLYTDPATGQMLMHLRPASAWIASRIQQPPL